MPRSKDLKEHEKWAVVARYNCRLYPGESKLRKGELTKLSHELKVTTKTISRIALEYKNQVEEKGFMDVSLVPKKHGHVGRKNRLDNRTKKRIHRKNTVTKGRLPLRMMAFQLGLKLTTLHRYMKRMGTTYRSLWIKPKLTEDHRMERIRFILKLRNGPRSNQFKNQFNTVVVDESWFYLKKDRTIVRLFPGDRMFPSDKIQHKSHIPKIMFLTALARPRPEHNFDGKIGIWRVEEEVICQKSNRYHRQGDAYVHDCTMNSALYKIFMMKVFKAVKKKMPWLKQEQIIIQQDGAPAHKGKGNMIFFDVEGQKRGWNIKVITQPAQSPDLNINDLAFFRSLKCRVENLKKDANNLDILYRAIMRAWNQYDGETLHRIWGIQYACYREILRLKGDNDYKVPHSGVRKLGPGMNLSFDVDEFQEARNLLRDYEGR